MITHSPEDYVCPFCCIARGIRHQCVETQDTDIIYHDNDVTLFIGSYQWPKNHGHVVIIPNAHYENVFDFPPEKAVSMQYATRAVAQAMKTAYACSGISTRQHNEPDGGQDVWHYHLHVFPRYQGDFLYLSHREPMAASERQHYAERLRKVFSPWTPSSTSNHEQ